MDEYECLCTYNLIIIEIVIFLSHINGESSIALLIRSRSVDVYDSRGHIHRRRDCLTNLRWTSHANRGQLNASERRVLQGLPALTIAAFQRSEGRIFFRRDLHGFKTAARGSARLGNHDQVSSKKSRRGETWEYEFIVGPRGRPRRDP